MFRTLNEKELTMINGGYRYVPMYKFGVCVGTAQVADDSRTKCYNYEQVWINPFKYEWQWVPYSGFGFL